MNIIFMGSAAFAVPALNALGAPNYKIGLVITQPDKPAGRGQKMTMCPIAERAKTLNLPLYQPTKIKNNNEASQKIKDLKPDFIIIVAYGKMLPKEILDIPKFGAVNVHSSLLPKYRGAAPIQWAIVNGETKTGVTTMRINEEMDAGDILLAEEINIEPNETAVTLHDKLSKIGAALLLKTLNGIKAGSIKPIPQDHSKATCAPIIKKEDGLIDWAMSAKRIQNLIRGMQPWPIAYTTLNGGVLKIFKATLLGESSNLKPGTILKSDGKLHVATKDNILGIDELQIEGKKRMDVTAFLRGHNIPVGTLLK